MKITMPDCDLSVMAWEVMDVQALIIDNNHDDCARLVANLRRGGYETVAVATASQAREALASRTFDLLLLELKLPDGDGLQLCNEIRERLGDQMVIIFVSNKKSAVSRVVGIELGADDFMDKPCDEDELLARIEVRLRRRGQVMR